MNRRHCFLLKSQKRCEFFFKFAVSSITTLQHRLQHRLKLYIVARWCQKIISKKKNSVHLRPPPNLALLLNQFNNTSLEQNINPENVEILATYFDIDEISNKH